MPNHWEPQLSRDVWYRIFDAYLLFSGNDQISEAGCLALLRRSLGAEQYRICIQLCPADIGYVDRVTPLDNNFQPRQTAIYSRAQFTRLKEEVGENCLEFVRELRPLAGLFS